MFGYILTGVFTLLHMYVFQRILTLPFPRGAIRTKILVAVGLILWLIFVSGRIIMRGQTGILAECFRFIGMQWLGIVFLTSIILLAVDLTTGFGFLLRRYAPLLRGTALAAGAALSVFAFIQGARAPVIEKYDVHVAELPDDMNGAVIIGLSDLHLGAVLDGEWMKKRVKQVMAERPDMVVLLGDIFEGDCGQADELRIVMSGLEAPLGVWAVSGNHEFHGGGKDRLKFIEDSGAVLLRDRWFEIRPRFIIAGVDDLTTRKRRGSAFDHVSKALDGRPAGVTIFLSHTPWQAEDAARAGVDLMLGGHTHGGQIWPFGYLVRLFYPLLAGRYDVSGMSVIVCRGTGTWGPRMRLWQPGEILKITLRGGNK